MPSPKCPIATALVGTVGAEIPNFCLERCEGLWDQAITNDNVEGPYETYSGLSDADCRHQGRSDFSSETLINAGNGARLYVIVDECTTCGTEVGEQAYRFNCPND